MRFPHLAHRSAAAHKLHGTPQQHGAALRRRITELQSSHPGIAVETLGSEWRIAIPEAIRVGHDAAFGAFTRRFLACVADPPSLPARETPNLLAKYRVTTGAVAISRR